MDRQAVFLAALRVRHPDERAACLDQMCGTDVALRREVEELLQAHDRERAERAAPPAPIHHGARPSTRPSRGRVAVAQGALPRFADETTALLRKRLMILALAMGIIRTVGLLTILSYPGLWLRLLVAGVYVGTFFLTWSSRPLSYRQLRWLELACLGGFTIQAVYMPSHLILARARAGDFATVVMDQYFLLGAWSVHLMGYAFLIPNTWQRAAALLIPLGLLPYANFAFLEWYEPRVAEAFAAPHHGPPYLLPLVAVFYSICFTHVMHAIRRESFRASRFGQYVLLEKLGGGGMGVVYKAEHQLLKRPCAIKLIRPGSDLDADMLARFEQEVRITARLSHWNTVEIYDYGRTEDGQFYYVMELLRGLSLADLVERHGPLPPERVVHLLRQVCAALHEAHGQGLIHRDLKPANIFAAQRGGIEDVAKLLDFGLVRQTGDGPGESQLLVGSPPYMSPEQAAASAALDPRSDIYALGAVAYCLLTGQPPFRCDTVQEYVQAHLRQPVLPPALVQPGVPPDLERVVLCCLEKVPDRRFPDVAALDRALGTCACAEQWTAARAAQWWQAQRATLDSAGLPGAASWPSHAEPAPSPRPEQTVRVVMPGLGDS